VATPARQQSVLSEAQLMSIISSSHEAIITLDGSQRIVLFNPAAERMFGCPAASALGNTLAHFIPDRFRSTHPDHLSHFGMAGPPSRPAGGQGPLFGLRADGTEFPLEASISRVQDGAGMLLTVLLRDATETLAAQQALLRSHEALRNLSANLQQVREDEKARIARELHDDLGQRLTALKMDVSFIERELAARPGSDSLLARVESMRQLIDTTVAAVRRIAADMRPMLLDDLGLVSAIEWLAEDFTKRYGIAVDNATALDDRHFSPEAATALFRIVQEALTNVARHAQASHVTLQLRNADACYVLRVADNGRGNDASIPTGEGAFGLFGIRERARRLGGDVSIDTAPGQGFAVVATFPERALMLAQIQP
jgi:PAS domain S-box-containing protein